MEIQKGDLRHKLDVDAATGDILKYERKVPKTAALQSVGPVSVTPERARAIALERANGGTVVAYKLDREKNGRVKYDVDVVSGGTKFDFKIDAMTGEIFRFKQDPVRRY